MSGYLRVIILIVCVLAALKINEAIALDIVVVESNALDLPVGSVISAGVIVELERGNKITVLGADGSIGILKGPYKGPVSEDKGQGIDDGEVIGAVKSLITKPNKQTSALGAVRSLNNARDSGIWNVPVSKSGVYCFLHGTKPKLVRENTAKAIKLTVKKRKGLKYEVVWSAGERSVGWPTQVPIEDGAVYSLKLQGQPLPKKIRVFLINRTAEKIKMIPALVEKKCLRQAQLVLGNLISQQKN